MDEDDAVDWLGEPRLELLVKDDVATYQGKPTHAYFIIMPLYPTRASWGLLFQHFDD
jgi:hypothetical protein